MNSSRLQHTIPASVILGIAGIVTYISFTQQPADAFLFPRLISVFFVGLAIWNFLRAVLGMAKIGNGISLSTIKNIVPGVIIMLIYIFFAAKNLGFYVSSWAAFMLIYTAYDPAPLNNAQSWLKRLLVTTGFMVIIYLLFANLLQVQTPRGLFF